MFARAVLLLEAMTNQCLPSDVPPASVTLEMLLSSHSSLTTADLALVRSAFDGPEIVHAHGAQISREPGRSLARLVVRGWVARGAVLMDGRRQIVGVHLPGDVVTAPAGQDGDMAVWALTEGATTDANRFWRRMEQARATEARLGQAWSRVRAAEQGRLVHQVVRLGRLNAYERTAHLLLELHDKQIRIGMAQPGRLALPITHDMLADILGLSVVHMNRTLQQLRRDGLISYSGGQMLLPDLAGLGQAARLGLEQVY